jgi:flavin-dependent dehydrogenase
LLTNPREFDAAIIGAGPAGVAAALRLTKLGYRICLLHRSRARPSLLPETCPRLDLLEHALPGLPLDERSGLGRLGAGRNLWTGAEMTTPPTSVINRGRFDRALVECARAQGVGVFEIGPTALRFQQDAFGAWIVSHAEDTWRAPMVVDASGRFTSLSEHAFTPKCRTIAFVGIWQTERACVGTLLEPLAEGWLWACPAGLGSVAVVVFADASALQRARPQSIYHEFIASSVFGSLIANASATCFTTRDVTFRHTVTTSHRGRLTIGDAALARDPLASQGILGALTDGLRAAAVIHTSLTYPERAAAAGQFFVENHTSAVRKHRELLGDAFHQMLAEGMFWKTRRALLPRSEPRPFTEPDHSMVLLGNTLTGVEFGPALEGNEIVVRLRLCAFEQEDAIAYWDGQPVERLLAPLNQPLPVWLLIQAWVEAGWLSFNRAEAFAAALLRRQRSL